MRHSIELPTLFAHLAHDSIGQTRKDNVRPYWVHTDDVRRRLSQVTVNPLILAAADLHDVVEDVAPKGKTLTTKETFALGLDREFIWKWDFETIEHLFGKQVRRYVYQLTDVYTKEAHPDKNRRTRKQLERERYETFDAETKWIKLADIASNLNDDGTVLESDGRVEVGFNRMFGKEKALCLPYLKDDSSKENVFLYSQAMDILNAHRAKFHY